MNVLRISLHLALVLGLTSLTCGIGAACAAMGETCCCMMEDGSSPCTEVSGGGEPVSPEPATTLDSGERFSVAVVEATPLATSPGASASLPDGRALEAVPVSGTPLYLSHCAFLC